MSQTLACPLHKKTKCVMDVLCVWDTALSWKVDEWGLVNFFSSIFIWHLTMSTKEFWEWTWHVHSRYYCQECFMLHLRASSVFCQTFQNNCFAQNQNCKELASILLRSFKFLIYFLIKINVFFSRNLLLFQHQLFLTCLLQNHPEKQ